MHLLCSLLIYLKILRVHYITGHREYNTMHLAFIIYSQI